jgi:hypothetical protein
MYLCGADLVVRCGGLSYVGGHGVIAIGRPGYSEDVRRIISNRINSCNKNCAAHLAKFLFYLFSFLK